MRKTMGVNALLMSGNYTATERQLRRELTIEERINRTLGGAQPFSGAFLKPKATNRAAAAAALVAAPAAAPVPTAPTAPVPALTATAAATTVALEEKEDEEPGDEKEDSDAPVDAGSKEARLREKRLHQVSNAQRLVSSLNTSSSAESIKDAKLLMKHLTRK